VRNYLLHGLAALQVACPRPRLVEVHCLQERRWTPRNIQLEQFFLASDWLCLRFASCYSFVSLRERRGDKLQFLSSLSSASSNYSFSLSTCRPSLGTSLPDSSPRITTSCIQMRVTYQRLRLPGPANAMNQKTAQTTMAHMHPQLPDSV
jgi:hypothetical protein